MNRLTKRCIIIPAFNEEDHIASVVEGVKRYSDAHIVVIDDGSRDLTGAKAREAGAFVISHPFNMGYGVALQTGYKYSVKRDYDFLVQMDGDRQHDPKYIEALFRIVESNECDVALGSRFLGEGNFKAGFLKTIGIKIFRLIIWIFNRKKITDPTSGYQCLNRKVLEVFTEDSFLCDYPDTNVIIMLHGMGFTIKEIPVAMVPNPEGRSMHQGIFTLMYYFFQMFFSFFIALIREKK